MEALGRRAWLRPAALAIGGLLLAVVLAVAADQLLAGVLLALFALFMAYWTSPLRQGPHVPLAEAMHRRSDAVTIIVWAPGDPLSARLQTALRTPREDLVWVNAAKDEDAERLVEELGGPGNLPVVIVGSEVATRATVGRALDMRAAGQERARQAEDGLDGDPRGD